MSTIAKDDFHAWEWKKDTKKQTKRTLVSTIVIVAGVAVLVNMNRWDAPFIKEPVQVQTQQAILPVQVQRIQAVLGTTAGAASVLDSDFMQASFQTTAGAAAILDREVIVELSAKAVQEAAAEESEYANLAIANVNNYVNVRSAPNTDSEVVGKMYDGSVAQILSTAGAANEWFQVISGNVEGYIKAEYFIYGDAAASVVDNYVTRYIEVQADRLNVREEPEISSGRIGYIDHGERAKLIEWGEEWSKIRYTDAQEGYVASEYVTVVEEFIYAKSVEEEAAEQAAMQELRERTQASEEAVPERTMISAAPPQTNYASVSALRNAVVDYAMQYLGNRYVHGGQSLASGTDCSGFTCYVYQAFGYHLSRTPQGQYTSAGQSINMAQIQPGDVICYSSNGSSCTHVGLYIGNGQIIHAANSRKGVIISNYDYDGVILGVRSIVE
ncbi:MAG: C40 family peptidase [Lachnospiraceae bacterium]|nr:C40 family peptidase [Lachnospiraceae bacterium]